jgi:hypothetical protein
MNFHISNLPEDQSRVLRDLLSWANNTIQHSINIHDAIARKRPSPADWEDAHNEARSVTIELLKATRQEHGDGFHEVMHHYPRKVIEWCYQRMNPETT